MNETKLTFKDYAKALGPGAIMSAAIIGPGTVTTASVQGANNGYAALWVLLVSCIIAYLFQEPAIRIAIGCKESVMVGVRNHVGKGWAVFLYIVILVGSLAFQAGNLTGAGMALSFLFPGTSIAMWAVVMSILALIVVLMNKYKVIENVNQLLIILMVLAFFVTMFASKPNWGQVITEGFSFKIPGGNAILAIGLLATTVTPNLILAYGSFLRKKYPNSENPGRDMKLAKADLGLNMFITFVITGAIIICSGTLLHPQGITVASAADMAQQLVPLLGQYAGVFFALGLWAAAISSVIYQVSIHQTLLPEALGIDQEEAKKRTAQIAIVCVIVLVPIAVILISGSSPVSLIISAQALNGIALPLSFILGWLLTTKKDFMKQYVNTTAKNVVMGITTCIILIFAVNALRNVIINLMSM